jgi:flap endonuclease-1
MGIKLKDLVHSEPINASELAGAIIAIDAPNIITSLFSFSHKQMDHSKFFFDSTQRPISHLYGLLYRVKFYYSKKILPIFCFDGVDSKLKRFNTTDKLHDFRFYEKWRKQALKSGDWQKARNISLNKNYLWSNIIKESKQLLGALGVPYLTSPASAESQCAKLVKDGIAKYSNSQDYDSLLFGCPKIVRNLSKSLKRKIKGRWMYEKVQPELIDLKKTLDWLQINQFQLVDMGLLIGTDYFSGIKNIGPKTAWKAIRVHNTIESVINTLKEKFDFSEMHPELITKVRKIFLFPDVLETYPEFHWNPPVDSLVIKLMCQDHSLDKYRVTNNLEKTTENYYKTIGYCSKHLNQPRSIQKTLFDIS